MRKPQAGFTLIEIAIVLVIIGLLLGGVLKGQELITAARVRNLVTNQDGVKAAYFGFLDRYRALPGDYNAARTNVPGCTADATCPNGDGDGQIEAAQESIASWSHLSKAGFITGSYDYNATESPNTTPTNPYGSRIQLIYDAVYEGAGGSSRHNLKTGPNIPSEIMAEVDRKADDGNAATGQLRYSAYAAGGSVGDLDACAEAGGNRPWKSQTPTSNCGAALLF
jgi:prepilin-type N-terminal cleavage/methylation domain-containing protein